MNEKERAEFRRGYRDGYDGLSRMSWYPPYIRGHIFGVAFKLWNSGAR